MNKLLLLPLAACCLTAYAADRNDSGYNTRYVESEEIRRFRNFSEAEEALPPFPETGGAALPLYISPSYPNRPEVLLAGLHKSADGSIRYILNVKSPSGTDNISAEAFYCSPFGFADIADGLKKSSYKIYAWGDTAGRKWIPVRNPQWKDIGSVLSGAGSVHGELYKTWCTDGIPGDTESLIRRLRERGGKTDAVKTFKSTAK